MTSTHRLFILLFSFVLAASLGSRRAGAADFRLTLANDPVSASSRPDDLYTSAFAVEMAFDWGRAELGERMFTDRKRGLRFDETHLSVTADLPPAAGWEREASLGVLRVGRGFLGQDAQNEVHEWIGSDRVDLPYIQGDHDYATAAAGLSRALGRAGVARLSAEASLFTAPGFRSWLRAGVLAERPLARGLVLLLGLGARADLVETPWVGDTVLGQAP